VRDSVSAARNAGYQWGVPLGEASSAVATYRGQSENLKKNARKDHPNRETSPNVAPREGIRSTRRHHATARSFNCRLFPGRRNGKRNIRRRSLRALLQRTESRRHNLFASNSLSHLEQGREIPSSQPGFCPRRKANCPADNPDIALRAAQRNAGKRRQQMPANRWGA
jgi:hypothetical protein